MKKGGEVLLDSPVRRPSSRRDSVSVEPSAGRIRARRVIVALPPPLAGEIAFSPDSRPERRELLSRLPMGAVIKCVAAYREPFWRARGLSGQSVCDRGPVNVTFDASPKSGSPGLLLAFIEGPAARELASWDLSKRRGSWYSTRSGRALGARRRAPRLRGSRVDQRVLQLGAATQLCFLQASGPAWVMWCASRKGTSTGRERKRPAAGTATSRARCSRESARHAR